MSFVRIWIHAVWRTKYGEKVLSKGVRKQLFEHIGENAQSKNIYIDTINGHYDHVHCLMGLKSEQSISTLMRLIKGESSFWMNKNGIIDSKFEWAIDYYAISVSESQVKFVRAYIRNQEKHHAEQTCDEECNTLFKHEDKRDDRA